VLIFSFFLNLLNLNYCIFARKRLLSGSVFKQGCVSGLIYYGSGSSIFVQSGSGSKIKQNFWRRFLFQIFLKSKFESNQIKNTCVIHHIQIHQWYLVHCTPYMQYQW
jgi:hypothetical protein